MFVACVIDALAVSVRRIEIVKRALALVSTCVLVAACATTADPHDPYEPLNRDVYGFNDRLDKAVLQPVAHGYRAALPQFVRQSIANAFSNIGDVGNVLNNTLQGKFATAYSDLGRIFINSTLGVLGLFDVASEAGIDKHNEDFGQTLGVWGVRQGPYIVLPVLGPSSARDMVGTLVDFATDPLLLVDPVRVHNQLLATRAVDTRASLLDASAVLQQAALDPYLFVRDAYLQRRENLVRDGMAPPAAEERDRDLRADR